MVAGGFAVTVTVTLTPTTDSSSAFRLAGVREQNERRPVSRERRLSQPDILPEAGRCDKKLSSRVLESGGKYPHEQFLWGCLVIRAIEFAAQKHRMQRRKSTNCMNSGTAIVGVRLCPT
jgi:hypothetical protein